MEVLLLRGGRCLVDARSLPVCPTGKEALGLVRRAAAPVFLGLAPGRAVFAIDLGTSEEGEGERGAAAMAGAVRTADLRDLVPRLDPVVASRLAYARGLFYWHDRSRFCGKCGKPTTSGAGGHMRTCTSPECAEEVFPRISPAVIVLVESAGAPPRCLLGRHRGSEAGRYSTLAGFVEIGESLEEAVRREVLEEAGVTVGTVTYQSSQSWPFPSSIMLAFRAKALDDAARPDGEELVDVRWFTREELAARAATSGGRLGRSDSIDRILLEGWLAQAGAGADVHAQAGAAALAEADSHADGGRAASPSG